ncbi:MAG: peptidase M16 [Bacteroidetes bacterium CG23_combo_of_CG06-09_8_20_14_all_32_9]|nr:MAG: peptidase M16 [Bacteroidetes bacterium CG23_combo_of_CG06-09_8_20_14_all_32_9]
MNYKTYTLNNGLRLIHRQTEKQVVHCGIIINTGTRDEFENEHGLAHFHEHLVFKGTHKRKAYHIISRMEDVGGEIDAYTTKEETCIYASFLNRYYDRTMELMNDIIFHSVYPEKEIIREREVILDEINSYKDSPAELIFDDFEELVFDGHSLGRNILGAKKTLKKFNTSQLHDFFTRTYNTDQIVFCSVGNIDFDKLVKYFEKYFGEIYANKRSWKRKPFKNYKPVEKTIVKKTHQSHCIIGTTAYNFRNKKRLPFLLLTNLLAGSGLNTRLNLSLREKNGLVYYIESSYTPYYDTGIFNIYFGCDNDKLNKSINIIKKELTKIKEEPLGIKQLQRAKQQMIGQIAISLENPEILLLNLGKSYLLYNKVDSLEVVTQRIELITTDDILAVANEIFNEQKFSTLIYK